MQTLSAHLVQTTIRSSIKAITSSWLWFTIKVGKGGRSHLRKISSLSSEQKTIVPISRRSRAVPSRKRVPPPRAMTLLFCSRSVSTARYSRARNASSPRFRMISRQLCFSHFSIKWSVSNTGRLNFFPRIRASCVFPDRFNPQRMRCSPL